MDETVTSDKKQDRPWLFKKGQSGNPAGRPKGSISLKTRVSNYLMSLSDEEFDTFLEGIPKIDIWKMGEGSPATATDVTSKGERIMVLPSEIVNKNALNDKPVS